MQFLRSVGLLALLGSEIVSASEHGRRHEHFHATNERRQLSNTEPDYDYVVVGSGPGGGPLAARLAIAGHKVLLIEAGDDQGNSTYMQVPALHLHSTQYEPMRWDYWVNHYPDLERQAKDSKMTWKTPDGAHFVGSSDVPQGSEPLGILYPRAGTLGGCSAHNAMITVYPHESDWTSIATITGDDSWAPSEMRKYFQRLERARYLPNGMLGHGFSGWLETSVTDLTMVLQDLKIVSLVVAAGTAMGKSIGKVISTVTELAGILLSDINVDLPSRDSTEGMFQVPLAVSVPEYKRNGPRDFILDTANALHDNGTRKYHLDIRLNTLVTNVKFDHSGSKPRAIGVDYLEGQSLYAADPRAERTKSTGNPGSVLAKKEVILSAGAFNTPQLLKLSGIGPRAELEKFDIPVLVDLPGVGKNLQDRYETGLVGKTDSDFFLTSKCTFMETPADPCLERYENLPIGKGTYTTNGIAIAIVKRSSVASGDPDLLISGAPAHFPGYYPDYARIGLKDARHWTWIVLKGHSRNNAGTVELRSTDPRDMPIINFNSFDAGVTEDGADEKDLQAVVEAMEFSRKIFKNIIPLQGAFEEVWPGTDTVNTTEAMKEFIKNEAWGHHASCTCAIGADDDPNAVLDSNFRVRGVDGLRVVDASVFPKIPGFYLAVPVYMISEKASDVILGDA